MTRRGTFVDGDFIHLDSTRGISVRIPATRIPSMLATAKNSDNGRAFFALRAFDRDALQGAYDLLPDCDACHDAPAFNDMGDDHLFCDDCCSSAAGSQYDDKTEF